MVVWNKPDYQKNINKFIEVCSEYSSADRKVFVKCTRCDYKWEINVNNVFYRKRLQCQQILRRTRATNTILQRSFAWIWLCPYCLGRYRILPSRNPSWLLHPFAMQACCCFRQLRLQPCVMCFRHGAKI